MTTRAIALTLLTLTASIASAWIDTGHMVVAAIAERNLNPLARAEVQRLLALDKDPRTNSMATAACWADDFKTRENGPWHYINYHFRTDGKPTNNKPLEENVVWAIDRFSAIVGDRNRTDVDRLDALRFLLHFVGDVHQPLHAVARDTDQFPNGDRGGNDFAIESPALFGFMPRPPRNLHFLWDLGAGLYMPIDRPMTPENNRVIAMLADGLIAALPASKLKNVAEQNPTEWAKESLALAKSDVYNLIEKAVPSEAYLRRAREISAERATLAGYRLANLLNERVGGVRRD